MKNGKLVHFSHSKSFQKNMQQAISEYRRDKNNNPNQVMVHPGNIPAGTRETISVDGITLIVTPYSPILNDHVWIGIAE